MNEKDIHDLDQAQTATENLAKLAIMLRKRLRKGGFSKKQTDKLVTRWWVRTLFGTLPQ